MVHSWYNSRVFTIKYVYMACIHWAHIQLHTFIRWWSTELSVPATRTLCLSMCIWNCVRQYIRVYMVLRRQVCERYLAFLKYLIPFGWVRSGVFGPLSLWPKAVSDPTLKIQFKVINQGFGGDNNENVKWIFLFRLELFTAANQIHVLEEHVPYTKWKV